jgi:hypothetical protein
MVQQADSGSGGSQGRPLEQRGAYINLIWSGRVIRIPSDMQVYVGGELVWADQVGAPFTLDAEQHSLFQAEVVHTEETPDVFEGPLGAEAALAEGVGVDPNLPAVDTQSGGSGGGATTPVAGSSVDDLGIDFAGMDEAEIEAYVREELGFLAWMLDIPELRDLVFNALREGDTETAILAALQNTEWWRETEPTIREFTRISHEDPARVERLVSDLALDIRLEVQRLGLTIDPDRIREMAREAFQFGMVDLNGQQRGNLLTQAILNESRWSPEDLQPGELSASIDDLVQLAGDWLVDMAPETAAVWAERLEAGETTEEVFLDYVQDLSASRFPHLRGIIEQGISPRAHFEPYRQSIASMLEVSPNDIDLFGDPRFTEVVETRTEDGVRAMTLAETQRYVRGMPEWQTTMNGLSTAARTMDAVLAAFGE